MRVRRLTERRPWPFLVGAGILKPLLIAVSSRTWVDGHKIPVNGGCLVVVNHISHLDPLTTAHFVYDHGRLPRYLAKSGLFRNRLLSGFLRAAGQIPVERLTSHAIGAYDAAVEAVRAGECVVIYPEGTLTRDPALWPMSGKSGAARIALETGCPVIPVGHWGAQAILPPYAVVPDLFPRKHITLRAGDAVALDDLLALDPTPEVVAATTARIISALTAIVADLRGETPPAERFDGRSSGLHQIGNPYRKQKRST